MSFDSKKMIKEVGLPYVDTRANRVASMRPGELVRSFVTMRRVFGTIHKESPEVQESTTCCYAVQDKAWVSDPDGAPWEVYTVLADVPEESDFECATECCTPVVQSIQE